MEPAHLLGTGGAIGAVLRYLIARKISQDRFPVATLTVNLLGSFVLGLVVFLGTSNELVLFLGVGICGSFTTYSSFSFETVYLWDTGDRYRATLYALLTLTLCVLSAALAYGIATHLGP